MADPAPRCPDCNTPLKPLGDSGEKQEWYCPVALEAQKRGLLGKPGRKHKEVWTYKAIQK
jgi:hypothetical protein